MRLLILPVVALTGALVAVVPAIDLLAAPKNRPHDYKVSVTFQNDANKIQSDGGGPYEDGIGGVVAYIAASANGMLVFGTNTSNFAGRTLQFFFDTCVGPCGPPAGFLYLNENSGLQSNVLRNGAVPTGGMTAMTVGEELEAWVKFNIPMDSDPAYWNVCFDGDGITPPCSANGAASVNARIQRQSESTWRIFATAPAANADVIKDTSARRTTRYFVTGTYSMPFDLTVACVNTDLEGNCQ